MDDDPVGRGKLGDWRGQPLEDRVGVSLGPVIVNGCYGELPGLRTAVDDDEDPEAQAAEAARDFRLDRLALQQEQLDRLAERLPLPQLRLPFLFTAGITAADVNLLATHLADAIEALVALP